MRRWLWGVGALLGCVQPPEVSVVLAEEVVFGFVGEDIAFEAARTEGEFIEWVFGDGTRQAVEPGEAVVHQYASPGHYSAFLTADDGQGGMEQAQLKVFVTYPPLPTRPRNASSIAIAEDRVYVTLPDFDRIAVVEAGTVSWLPTCAHPATVSVEEGWMAVACADSDQLHLRELDTQEESFISLGWGARPFGVVVDAHGAVYATLQGRGEVIRVPLETGIPDPPVAELPDVRGLAIVDDRILVSRHRSPEDSGRWAVLKAGEMQEFYLMPDPGPDSDNDARGLPSYLQQVVVRPDGRVAVLPGIKANVDRGLYLEDRPFTDDSVARADLRQVGLQDEEGSERTPLTLDNRDRVSAAAFDPRGHLLLVATAGAQTLEVVDPFTMRVIGGALETGHGVRGLAVGEDGTVWLDAELSRELVVYREGAWASPPERIDLIEGLEETLDEEVLRGKQLFYLSADPRLTGQGYVACASCHLDGEDDHRTWDFTDRGEGLRNTLSLLGGGGEGPLHWSANFDEVQDFEHDIRGPQAGSGLMSDADFAECSDPLGLPKAGKSTDLDALAAYVQSLEQTRRSPWRTPEGAMTEAALAGQALFLSEQTGCAECHPPPRYTDSAWLAVGEPLLHDVGTLSEGSGQRMGATLLGIDTPSLVGLHGTAPYLHDGSAQTLWAVLEQSAGGSHGSTSDLSEAEVDQLVRFLLELE